jgi:transcriptional regulator with XRE-family HTH domain
VKIVDLDNLGGRVKKIRLEKRLNQTAFAKMLSVSGPAVVSKYEKNQRQPGIATMVKIVKLGNRSLDWLLTGKSPKNQTGKSKKLEKLISQIEQIYQEGDSKKLSAIQVLLDLAAPPKASRKKNKI